MNLSIDKGKFQQEQQSGQIDHNNEYSHDADDDIIKRDEHETYNHLIRHNKDSSLHPSSISSHCPPSSSFTHHPSPATSPSQYQLLIYENKIQLLTDRLQCYMQEVQNLKRTNSILINKLSTLNEMDEQIEEERSKNLQLRDQVEIYRDRLEDEKDQNQAKINHLKQQLEEKDAFIELVRQESEKVLGKKEEIIATLRDALNQKNSKLLAYQKKLHNFQIERLNSEQDFPSSSQRDSLFTRNSNTYCSSRFNTQNSENNMNSVNMQKSTISVEDKAKQFMKRDPNELKIMMKSLSHAQKCLEIGGQQLSMITALEKDPQNKSILGTSRLLAKSKINKTYCN